MNRTRPVGIAAGTKIRAKFPPPHPRSSSEPKRTSCTAKSTTANISACSIMASSVSRMASLSACRSRCDQSDKM